MNVYRVWTTRQNHKGQPVFVDIISSIPTLEMLMARFNDRQMVMAMQLWTRFAQDEQGKFLEILKERPIVIAPAMVDHLEIPEYRYVRFVEEVPA